MNSADTSQNIEVDASSHLGEIEALMKKIAKESELGDISRDEVEAFKMAADEILGSGPDWLDLEVEGSVEKWLILNRASSQEKKTTIAEWENEATSDIKPYGKSLKGEVWYRHEHDPSLNPYFEKFIVEIFETEGELPYWAEVDYIHSFMEWLSSKHGIQLSSLKENINKNPNTLEQLVTNVRTQIRSLLDLISKLSHGTPKAPRSSTKVLEKSPSKP